MSCVSPNKIFYGDINADTGKRKTYFAGYDTEYIILKDDGSYSQHIDLYTVHDSGFSPLGKVLRNYDVIPCGQCIGCRIDYSRTWATRLMLESKNYPKDQCWFVTLTYDDEHLPKPNKIVTDSGEVKDSPFSSVSKREHQLFMKRLRNKFGCNIRFFCCGEYGDISFRPHYHYILFGLKIPDLVFYKSNFRCDLMYTSELLSHCWSDEQSIPYGFVVVSPISFDTCSYVARYVMKKRKGKDFSFYEKFAIEPEFCLMSRRPGIGKDYFSANYEYIYKTDSITLGTDNGSFTVKPPKYFDSLLENTDSLKYDYVRNNRKKQKESADKHRKKLRPFLDEKDIFSAQKRAYENRIIIKKKGEI